MARNPKENLFGAKKEEEGFVRGKGYTLSTLRPVESMPEPAPAAPAPEPEKPKRNASIRISPKILDALEDVKHAYRVAGHKYTTVELVEKYIKAGLAKENIFIDD